jgi:hypothetical protein
MPNVTPWRRKPRFRGAGGSAEKRFKSERRANIRETWYAWLGVALAAIGLFVWSFYTDPLGTRILALSSGILIGVLFVMWALGGHISSFRWWQGAEGERQTAREIEKLDGDWHCEHDIEYPYGNFDHVLVGPPGLFLLDTKSLTATVSAKDDTLIAGRVRYPGVVFRAAAKSINTSIERRLERRCPWVQAVVVIWGDFPQARHEERDVVYMAGEELVAWITQLPQRVNAPQRAALRTALDDLRASAR